MDGTIANLYGYPNWLQKIRKNMTEPYEKCSPMQEYNKIIELLNKLKQIKEIEIIVISWTAMGADKNFKKAIKKAKINWLKENNFPFDKVHIVQYGTKKNTVRKDLKNAILFDDDEKVRATWENSFTEKEIIATLNKLLTLD